MLPLLAMLLAAAPLAADEAQGRAQIAVLAPTDVVLGEVFPVAVHVTIDRPFFDARAVALFRQPVDVPLHVRAPWRDAIAGLQSVAPPHGALGPTIRIAVDDAVVPAALESTLGGAGRQRLVVVRWFRAARAGAVELPGARLRFAHATRFEEDFFGGRTPIDRADATIDALPRVPARVAPPRPFRRACRRTAASWGTTPWRRLSCQRTRRSSSNSGCAEAGTRT